MSHDRSKTPRRGWRDAVASTPPAVEGKRKWQQTTQPVAPKLTPGKRRRIKLGLAATALVVILGLLAAILFWPRAPRSACLVLLGAGYEENLALPHNAAGWNGLAGLRQLAQESGAISSWLPWLSGKQLRLQHEPMVMTEKTDLEADVFPKAFANFNERTVIVYVSLHGGADEKGAYLFADDPRTQKRVYVEKLLDRLNGDDLQGKNKLLILDCGGLDAHWAGGLLHNDFARSLKRLEDKIKKVPNLVVLCANAADQRSWVSEEWQQTIFAHYFTEGLKGAADADRTGRVTAWELHRYVAERVSAWADHNRDAVQTPVLLGDETAARDMELVQVEQAYTEQPFTAAPGLGSRADDAQGELRAAWAGWRQLQETSPHPAVYSPHLWRNYQDALVRYEQLVRLGDPTNKKKALRTRLTKLASQIGQSRALLPAAYSLDNTLTMPAVHGVVPVWPEKELRPLFDELRAAKDTSERNKAWEKLAEWLKKQEPANERQRQELLEVQLSRWTLAPLAAKERVSAGELRQAAELLQWINSRQSNLRPAEAHFLIMMLYEKIAPPKLAPDGHLQLALQVRLLAEETALGTPSASKASHLYSEAVYPWVRAKVDAADDRRCRGEDWLFGSTKDSWDEAEKLLREAKKLYTDARGDAEVVRDALQARDQVLAVLPYYARWAAGQWLRNAAKERRERIEGWLDQVEKVGREADALCARLRSPTAGGDGLHAPPANPDSLDPRALRKLTNDLQSALAQLRKDFARECEELSDVQQQGRWHDIQNVLAVPLIDDLDLRLRLAANSRGISNKLHETRAQKPVGAADPVALAALHRDRARNEGRMALAVAGEPWSGQFSRQQVRKSILEATDEGWRATLTHSGKYVREHWRQRLDDIKQGWSKSLDEADLDKAAKALEPPEHFCRLALAEAMPDIPSVPFDPVQAARRLRFHALLCAQAERAALDHWFMDSDNPRATYYVPAAEAFLKDALHLAVARSDTLELNNARQKRAKELQKGITLARVTAKHAAPQQHLTGDQRFDLAWNFTADKGVPPGVPMVWLEMKEDYSGTFEKIDRPDYVDRRPLVRQPEWLPASRSFELVTKLHDSSARHPPVPTTVYGVARLRGVYRGQRIEAPVELKVQDSADIIYTRYPPAADPEVRLTMAPNLSYGALSIVIDFSGSMGEPLKRGGPGKKIEDVRAALQELLPKIPEGTYLSVAIYGHKTGSDNTEESVEHTKIKWIRPPQRWSSRATKRLIEDLFEAETPWNYTPVAESLYVAKERGFPPDYKGPKVILALTDGKDNIFKLPQNEYLRRRYRTDNIRAFVESVFGASDIEVNVVCFTRDVTEMEEAKKQFDVVEKLARRGNFFPVDESRDLTPTLVAALLPQLVFHDRNGRVNLYDRGVVQKDQSLPATPPGKNNIWRSIKVGDAEGSVLTAHLKRLLSQQIRLRRGERMMLQVDQKPGGAFFLERLAFATVAEEGKPANEKTAQHIAGRKWLAAVLQNRITTEEKGKLTQLITVEDVAQRRADRGTILEHLYPGFAWLEVATGDDKLAPGLRWHQEYGYPAPAFRIHAGGVKPSDRPKTSLWFSEGAQPLRPVAREVPLGEVKLGQELTVEDGTRFVIEKLEHEDRYVTVADGDRQVRKCLVVHVKFDPDRPVWVQAVGGAHRGEEHHFYTKGGKYVGLFWGGVNPSRLNVVSVNAFKNRAAEQGQKLDWTMPHPEPHDTGPSIEKLGR